jgi:D-alanyl-D-alanine carboxypeptidase/D-alanyl-D-alanine-endopeptidase (penicillin-binding protein 4)
MLAIVFAAAGAAPASAYDAAALKSALAREMQRASPSSSADVRDLDTGRELYALRATTARLPASVEKLYTTATTLLRLGPGTTLDTRAVSDGGVDAAGVLHGDLVLVGGGDPFFGAQPAARLAAAVKASGIARIDGAVIGDESGFDALRSGCCSGYDPDLGGVLSALAYDRGLLGSAIELDAARFAAARFADQLRTVGVRSSGVPRAGIAPRAAVEIASKPSIDIGTMIGLVNVPSNNFAAEMMLKALGRRAGTTGSTLGGAAVVRRTLGTIGLRPQVVDGSGLSRTDRTTARDVVGLLDRMDDADIGDTFRASLAIAGRTGTVRNRLRHTAAFGRCRLKTGTLRDVSALAGYCRTRGERNIAFALLMNRVRNLGAAHAIQDHIAAAIARLDGAPMAVPPAAQPRPSAGAGPPTSGAGPS